MSLKGNGYACFSSTGFPSALLCNNNVRLVSLLLDRQQPQTGASPCGQEEEDLVHCAAERETELWARFMFECGVSFYCVAVCVVNSASAGSYNEIDTE